MAAIVVSGTIAITGLLNAQPDAARHGATNARHGAIKRPSFAGYDAERLSGARCAISPGIDELFQRPMFARPSARQIGGDDIDSSIYDEAQRPRQRVRAPGLCPVLLTLVSEEQTPRKAFWAEASQLQVP